MLGAILAIIKAIPKIQAIFESLMALYIQHELDSMKQENLDAIKEAIKNHDQRKIEKSIGAKEGLPSNDPGAVILPGPPPNVLPKP